MAAVIDDLMYKVWYLLAKHVETDEGVFCFPDGDIWDLQRDGPEDLTGIMRS